MVFSVSWQVQEEVEEERGRRWRGGAQVKEKITCPVLNMFMPCPWDFQRKMSGRFGHKDLLKRRASGVIEIWEPLL